MDHERPVPLCVRFLRTRHGVSLTHRVRGHRTPEVATGVRCATPSPPQRVRRPATGGYTACRIDFVFFRWRLTHLSRKPRIPRYRLHICFRSRAPGKTAVVTVVSDQTDKRIRQASSTSPDETVTAPAVCHVTNIDHVPLSGTHSGSNAMLCVFEDNEAVIKMIVKG